MTRLVDLSHNIESNMPLHPYDSTVKLYQDKFLATDKYNNYRLEIGMHAGTHIDTPMHLTDSKEYINELSLSYFIGNGCLLDVRGQKNINYKQEYDNLVFENDIALLYTNHSEKYGAKEYFLNYPVVEEELADFFVKKKIKMLGMDLPAPDKYPFPIHKILFNNNILIIENLTNLAELVPFKKFEIIALPLKIKAEASPTRVVARVL